MLESERVLQEKQTMYESEGFSKIKEKEAQQMCWRNSSSNVEETDLYICVGIALQKFSKRKEILSKSIQIMFDCLMVFCISWS